MMGFVGERRIQGEFARIVADMQESEVWGHEIVRITGDEGYGKSSWCRYWVNEMSQIPERPVIPILVHGMSEPVADGRTLYRGLFEGFGSVDLDLLKQIGTWLQPIKAAEISMYDERWNGIAKMIKRLPPTVDDWGVIHRFLSSSPLGEKDRDIVAYRSKGTVDPDLLCETGQDWLSNILGLFSLLTTGGRGVVFLIDEPVPGTDQHSLNMLSSFYRAFLVNLFNAVSDKSIRTLILFTTTVSQYALVQDFVSKLDRRSINWPLVGIEDGEELVDFARFHFEVQHQIRGLEITTGARDILYERLDADRSRAHAIQILEEVWPYMGGSSLIDDAVLRRAGVVGGSGETPPPSELRDTLVEWHFRSGLWEVAEELPEGPTKQTICESLTAAALGCDEASAYLSLVAFYRGIEEYRGERPRTLFAAIKDFGGCLDTDNRLVKIALSIPGNSLKLEHRELLRKGLEDLLRSAVSDIESLKIRESD